MIYIHYSIKLDRNVLELQPQKYYQIVDLNTSLYGAHISKQENKPFFIAMVVEEVAMSQKSLMDRTPPMSRNIITSKCLIVL